MWNEDALLDLRIPEQDESIIKVIGVGGRRKQCRQSHVPTGYPGGGVRRVQHGYTSSADQSREE